jgi:hypothetical protein
LKKRLAQAPRRRDFRTVPMILDHQEQWGHEALTEVTSYRPAPRQAWDNTNIEGPWLNLMRNAGRRRLHDKYADHRAEVTGSRFRQL